MTASSDPDGARAIGVQGHSAHIWEAKVVTGDFAPIHSIIRRVVDLVESISRSPTTKHNTTIQSVEANVRVDEVKASDFSKRFSRISRRPETVGSSEPEAA